MIKHYPFRTGSEEYRLQLIWEMYQYAGNTNCPGGTGMGPAHRWIPIAWDLCHIAGAIAGGYKIVLSSHYKGIQMLKGNKPLWSKISQYVVLQTGRGLLPHDGLDYAPHDEKWEALNGIAGFKEEK